MKNLLLLLALLLPGLTACLQKPAVTSLNIKKDTLLMAPETDWYRDTLFTGRGCAYNYKSIVFRSQKSFAAFTSLLNTLFGKPDSMHCSPDGKNRGLGTYFWHNKKYFGQQGIFILFTTHEYSGYFEGDISVFGPDQLNISSQPAVYAFFEKLIHQKVFAQHQTAISPALEELEPREFLLDSLLHINYDSLLNVSQLTWASDFYSIRIWVDTSGQISNTEGVDSSETWLHSYIAALNMPVVKETPHGRPIRYKASLELCPYSSNWLTAKLNACVDSTWNDNNSLSHFLPEPFIMGNVFEKNTKHALVLLPPYSCKALLFELQGRQWKVIDSVILCQNTAEINYYLFIKTEDFNGDNCPEIVFYTPSNMNGNSSHRVFYYNQKQKKLEAAGYFFASYETVPARGLVMVEHEGSWYMPLRRTLLSWQNNRLVTVRKAVLSLQSTCTNSNLQILSYYKNPYWQQGKDTLVLVKEVWYNEENPELVKLWENFFD